MTMNGAAPQPAVPCMKCGNLRAALIGPVVETSVLSLVGTGNLKVTDCPVCTLLEAVKEMRDHLIAIEKEMLPEVEEAAP